MENRQTKVANIAPDGPAYSIMAITSVFGIHWKIEQLAGTAGQGPNRHFCTVFDQDRIADEDALRDVLAPQGTAVSLPPRAVLMEMVSRYLKSVNRLFPIYNEEAFVTLVKHELSSQGCRNGALWASLNVMLAITLDSESRGCEAQTIAAYRYFHNAQCTLPSMLMLQGDLLSIQALLITALYLQLHRSVHSAGLLVTAALRSCHRLGLHISRSASGASDEVREQQERVFWVACVLDQSMALLAGTAPTQSYQDIGIEFPGSRLSANILDHDTLYFRLLCQNAVIRSKAFRYLYSAKALGRPWSETKAAVKDLNRELDIWKKSNSFLQGDTWRISDDMFTLMQRLAYCNTLILINQQCYRWDRAVADDASVAPGYAVQICLDAAWNSIELLGAVPWRNIDYIGILVDYLLFAARTLSTIAIGPRGDTVPRPIAQLIEVAYNRINSISQSLPNRLSDLQSHLTLLLLQAARTKLNRSESIAHHRI